MAMYFESSLFCASAVCLVLWFLHVPIDADVLVKSDGNVTIESYRDLPASPSFGQQFPSDGLWGYLYYTNPDDGCTPIEQPLNGSNWIAVLSMSAKCRFEEQVRNAQLAGFIAAIVYNNKSNILIEMKNASHRLNIPSTFIGLSSSNLLAQFDRRTNVHIVIVEYDYSDTEELLLIILAAVSSFSAVVVLGIVIGIGIHNCCRNRSQLLSRWKLKRLPVHVFKKGDLYENCAICLEEYNEGDKLRILPCAHAFHSKCIDEWLTKNRKTCPLCNETVNPSRRKKSRADSEQDQDDERRPLLMPVSNDNDSEPEGAAESHRNQSNVEIHEEPTLHRTSGRRNYGSAGVSDVLMDANPDEPDEPEGDSLFSVEYVNMFGRSPLCHIRGEPDSSTSSEVQASSSDRPGDEDRIFAKTESDAGFEEPEVVVSPNFQSRSEDNVV